MRVDAGQCGSVDFSQCDMCVHTGLCKSKWWVNLERFCSASVHVPAFPNLSSGYLVIGPVGSGGGFYEAGPRSCSTHGAEGVAVTCRRDAEPAIPR